MTDWRIRVHLAIAFMACACLRDLARPVALQKRPMSPRVICVAHSGRQGLVLQDPENGKRCVVPSRPSTAANSIRATPGLDVPSRPGEQTAGGTGTECARARDASSPPAPDVAPGPACESFAINVLRKKTVEVRKNLGVSSPWGIGAGGGIEVNREPTMRLERWTQSAFRPLAGGRSPVDHASGNRA